MAVVMVETGVAMMMMTRMQVGWSMYALAGRTRSCVRSRSRIVCRAVRTSLTDASSSFTCYRVKYAMAEHPARVRGRRLVVGPYSGSPRPGYTRY
jgi:hypothetical protein